jgi:hypothetical protein
VRSIPPLAPDPEPTGPDWLTRAACLGADPDLWFDHDPKPAIRICRLCPSVGRCLEYAVVNGIDVGVWGGTTAEMRGEIAEARGIVWEPEPTPPRRCNCDCGRLARRDRRLASACQQREYRLRMA